MSSMNQEHIALIDAIVKNDMPGARKWARVCVAKDKTKKNEYDCKRLAKLLDPALNSELEKLPYKIEGMLEVERPAKTFQVSRYYLSPRESGLFEKLDRNRKVCEELTQLHIVRPNSTLLYGQSGTGKTTFGRYVATMFDLPFYYVNFSRLIDSLMGKTSQNLAAVFDYIRTVPCVLMLDEIDAVSTQRTGRTSGSDGEINRITVTLMQEFDKLQNTQILIAATNRLDIIDKALLRRFSRVHEVKVPQDEIEASRIIELLFDDCHLEYDRDELVCFCRDNKGKSQAWFINEAIERIAESIEYEQMESARNSGNIDFTGGKTKLLGVFVDGKRVSDD